MGQNAEIDRLGLEHNSSEKSTAVLSHESQALVTQSGNDIFRQLKANADSNSTKDILPNGDDLLKQLHDSKTKEQDSPSKSGADNQNPVIGFLNQIQHKIAEDALKDPEVKKVSESHAGKDGLETVTVERRDGTVITYEPYGDKVTVLPDGVKVTEFAHPTADHVKGTGEYPDGTKEYVYEDGSRRFVKGDQDWTIDKNGTKNVYRPDGTNEITQKDGTVIVEGPNGDRTVTKPEHLTPVPPEVHHSQPHPAAQHPSHNNQHKRHHEQEHKREHYLKEAKWPHPFPLPGNVSLNDWLE